MSDDDRDLRDRFARLRAEERADVSPFRAPVRRAPSRPAWIPRLAVAAAIVLVALVVARPDRPPRNLSVGVVDLRAATWRSPTDFLLTTPGSELMRTVPALTSPDHYRPIDVRGVVPAPESTRS
jgi:hypothetical protein